AKNTKRIQRRLGVILVFSASWRFILRRASPLAGRNLEAPRCAYTHEKTWIRSYTGRRRPGDFTRKQREDIVTRVYFRIAISLGMVLPLACLWIIERGRVASAAVPASANLYLEMGGTPDPVSAGDSITYTISFGNS